MQCKITSADSVALIFSSCRATSVSRKRRSLKTRCGPEEGLQLPSWPQPTFRRNLPFPQRLCRVAPQVSKQSPSVQAYLLSLLAWCASCEAFKSTVHKITSLQDSKAARSLTSLEAHSSPSSQGCDWKNAAQTVYTVRMSTGGSRGAGLSELCAGVWLGLVGQNGETFLHRAVPLCDSEVIEQELYQICQVQPGRQRQFGRCFCVHHPSKFAFTWQSLVCSFSPMPTQARMI